MIGKQYLQCCDLCHLDLGEGGEDGDAALAGHGDGCVHGASQRDVDQRQQEGKQPGEGGHLSGGCRCLVLHSDNVSDVSPHRTG